MGLNGCESWDISALYGNSANAKALIARPSFAAGGGSAVSGTTEGYTHILQSLCNSGAAGAQILTAFENTAAPNAVQANSPITFALNTASAFVSAAAGNLISSGTDSETLVQYSLTLRPN